MRYSQIREMDISNGPGIGIALFVQGCPIHCPGCFNQDTWDFEGGKEWTQEIEDKFLELCKRPHIERVSILGGEPLAKENIRTVVMLCNKIKAECPELKIWLYTGYVMNFNWSDLDYKELNDCVDYLVTGPYVHALRDMNLLYRGSSNQKILDMKKSIAAKSDVYYIPEMSNGLE